MSLPGAAPADVPEGRMAQPDDGQRVIGPSYPLAVKALATAMVIFVLMLGIGIGLRSVGKPSSTPGPWLVGLVVLASMVAGYWGILTSRTICGDHRLEQTWVWRKQVNLSEVTQIRLIEVPGLSWLVVPRLVVRTGQGVVTFPAGNPVLHARFRQLARGG